MAGKMDLRNKQKINYKLLHEGEPTKFEKQKTTSLTTKVLEDLYDVERIIFSRQNQGKKEYLVKWKDYQLYDSTWEPENHLPKSCVDSYENPDVSFEKVEIYSSLFEEMISSRLRSSSCQNVITFPADIYIYAFGSDSEFLLSDKTKFSKLKLNQDWDYKLNIHGQGIKIKFPMRLKLKVMYINKYIYTEGNVLKKRVPITKLVVNSAICACSFSDL